MTEQPPDSNRTTKERSRGPSQREILERLLAKDASLWPDDADRQAKIRERLGWLTFTARWPCRGPNSSRSSRSGTRWWGRGRGVKERRVRRSRRISPFN